MELWLLKSKHVFDEDYEELGIFSSKKKMEEGKKTYLKQRMSEGFRANEYRFTYLKAELDILL